MRVAIVGTGGIGRGYAAYLVANGHSPVLWSPTGRGLAAPTVALRSEGALAGTYRLPVARNCTEALDGAEIVLVAVDGRGLRTVCDALAPLLRPGQTVIFSAHLSFAALYLVRALAQRGLALPIACWATTVLTARSEGADAVRVSGIRQRLDVATLPADQSEHGLAASRALFGDRFEPRADVLAIMLSNLNPPSHMANMLCNFTRAEKGEVWSNYGGITPSVGRLIEALDDERLALAAAFGVTVRTIQQHYRLSFQVPPGTIAEMSAVLHAARPELPGPATLATRYVLEDVPFGLVPLEALARVAGVAVPLHNAGVALFSALYGTDFRAANDILPALGVADWSKAELHARLCSGWPRV